MNAKRVGQYVEAIYEAGLPLTSTILQNCALRLYIEPHIPRLGQNTTSLVHTVMISHTIQSLHPADRLDHAHNRSKAVEFSP